MKRLLRLAALPVALLLVGSDADAESYQIDATHSSIDFSIRHLVGRTKGRFNDYSGTIVYDAAKPTQTKITGTIQVSSISTGNEDRDAHLCKEDFFFVAEHPTITLESKKVEVKTDGLLQVTADFTMRGVTKEVTLLVEILGTGVNPRTKRLQIGLATEFTVKRSDYGVNSWTDVVGVLGDEVKIGVFIEANVAE
jgi:polyisoprenoid-binding protein YceI